MSLPPRTWVEISLGRIAQNARALITLSGAGNATMAVVKADAYGHGLIPVARACAAAGIEHLAVATLDEARALRRAGLSPEIYVLAPLLPEEADDALRHDIVPFVSSREFLEALIAAAAQAPLPARCVLVLDSGMGREGALPTKWRRLWNQARDAPTAVQVVGLATHLACADAPDTNSETFTREQVATFYAHATPLLAESPAPLWLSVANSPGLLRFAMPDLPPNARGLLTRPGIALYGIEPYPGALEGTSLQPALTWRARLTLIREMPAGATVGYGRSVTLTRPSRIATVAAGYGDGLSRRLSNIGTVAVQGTVCPLVGRISMDQCQIDVTDVPGALIGDVATLIGEGQSAGAMAQAMGTTPHEPTTALLPRVPRRYVR